MTETILKSLVENGAAAAVAVIIMAALFLPTLRKQTDTIVSGLVGGMHDVVEQIRDLVREQKASSISLQQGFTEAIRQGDATLLREMERNHAEVIRVLKGCDARNAAAAALELKRIKDTKEGTKDEHRP